MTSGKTKVIVHLPRPIKMTGTTENPNPQGEILSYQEAHSFLKNLLAGNKNWTEIKGKKYEMQIYNGVFHGRPERDEDPKNQIVVRVWSKNGNLREQYKINQDQINVSTSNPATIKTTSGRKINKEASVNKPIELSFGSLEPEAKNILNDIIKSVKSGTLKKQPS